MLKARAAAGEHDPAPPPDAAAANACKRCWPTPLAARRADGCADQQRRRHRQSHQRTKSPERASLVGRFDSALTTLQNDAALSRADRLTALLARVDLAKIDAPAKAKPSFSPALLADVIEHSARMGREISDGYERPAVIPTAAYLLEQAGLMTKRQRCCKPTWPKAMHRTT